MGINERKDREKQEMRNLIIETAKDMFIQEGFEKTSLRKIAGKIEYSSATIYLYFKDKSDLFCAIMDQGFAILLKQFHTDMEIQDPLQRLQKLGHSYIDFALKNTEYYDLMFIMQTNEEPQTPEQWCLGQNTFECLYKTIEECIQKDVIRISDPVSGSMMFWATVHGMVSLLIRERLVMFPQTELHNIINNSIENMISAIKK